MLTSPDPQDPRHGSFVPSQYVDDGPPPVILIDGRPADPGTDPATTERIATGKHSVGPDQTELLPSGGLVDPPDSPNVPDEVPDSAREIRPPHRRTAEEIITERLVPAEPDRGAGRFLRGVAGVDEQVLDWAPEERARYTRLGAIILNTGLLAGVSLLAALAHIVHAPVVALIGIAGFWAFLVISLDGWLIASTHGSTGSLRLLKFFPRLCISLLLGFVIAEPLVLWVFSPAVFREVQQMRDNDVDRSVKLWTTCNPASGVSANDPVCAAGNWVIAIPGVDTPQAQQQALANLTNQRDQAQARLAKDTAEWNRLNDLARAECNGKSGPGFSGVPGQGPNCDRDREEADQYRKDNALDRQQQNLAGLSARITAVSGKIRTATDGYGRQVRAAIAKRRADKVEQNDGQAVGLLEESAALGQLSRTSPFVFAAQWLLRALLVALDCMPVFAKMIGGTTTYDRMVGMRLRLRERMHDKDLDSTDIRYQHQLSMREDLLNDELRMSRARRQAEERHEIDSLVERFRARRAAQAQADI